MIGSLQFKVKEVLDRSSSPLGTKNVRINSIRPHPKQGCFFIITFENTRK